MPSMDRPTTDLARRVVACEAFRWLPGMMPDSVPAHDPSEGRYSRGNRKVVRVTINGLKITPERYAGAAPDLSDPLTVLMMLLLVRRAYPRAYSCWQPAGWFVCAGEGVWEADRELNPGFERYATEAEALVVALEYA
jgi:hypothetical protein